MTMLDISVIYGSAAASAPISLKPVVDPLLSQQTSQGTAPASSPSQGDTVQFSPKDRLSEIASKWPLYERSLAEKARESASKKPGELTNEEILRLVYESQQRAVELARMLNGFPRSTSGSPPPSTSQSGAAADNGSAQNTADIKQAPLNSIEQTMLRIRQAIESGTQPPGNQRPGFDLKA